MKCQSCGKEEASVKYYENINGEKREIMLCSNCAKNLNLIDFPTMLSYFFSTYPKELLKDEYTKEVCDKCSYTFDNYLEKGLFGCPDCYSAFSDRIDSLLAKIHGKTRHTIADSKPKVNSIKKSQIVEKNKVKSTDISSITDKVVLKNLLDISIKEEKYEDAAKIRDRIKELEK